MDGGAEAFFSGTQALRPKDLPESRQSLDQFVARHVREGRRCALVTSGGTTVPLEVNTVRFIDNFSTGTRGAVCTEELLKSGYAVVLLYRPGSNIPFLTGLHGRLRQDPVQLLQGQAGAAPLLPPAGLPEPLHLLALPFTTIFDYLFLLREACQALGCAGSSALVLLAAAVADFYVPEEDMAKDKIQSRAADGLQIQLQNVPKLLGAVRSWAPQALMISFKLETNANILDAKAAGAICKYGVDAVCANLLQSYREWVKVVRKDPRSTAIDIATEDITGSEEQPIPVRGLLSELVERGPTDASTDAPLARAAVRLHDAHQEQRSAVEPEAKRSRTGEAAAA